MVTKPKNSVHPQKYKGQNPNDKRSFRSTLSKIFEQAGGIYRTVKLAKEDQKFFLEILKLRSSLEPKEMRVENDTVVNVVMNLPRPENEGQLENKKIDLVDYTIDEEKPDAE